MRQRGARQPGGGQEAVLSGGAGPDTGQVEVRLTAPEAAHSEPSKEAQVLRASDTGAFQGPCGVWREGLRG